MIAEQKHTPGPSLLADPATHPCGFCKSPSKITTDTADERKYECASCGAVETISKGKTSWWYHGWKRADGSRLRAPTSAEMWAGKFDWQPDRAAIAKAEGRS